MTSQLNLEDIYTELNNLLKDVCSFLTIEAQNGTLSAKAKNEAEKLVSRSRQQVDIVTKLSVIQESTSSNYPYLEMLPGGAEEPLSEYVPAEITDYYELEHYEETQGPEDNEPIIPTPPASIINEDLSLHKDLPLSMLEGKSVKYGPLCRKERYFIIEQKKQYMVGLVGYWLLIYALNKKDQKPIQIYNLLNYSARSIEQRKEPAFEIYAENEKTYEFIARSIKDMEQWVVAINCKKHICTNGRNLPEIPIVTISEEFNNSDRNSNQINDDSQNVMHYGSDEGIYASVEDFGKLEIAKRLSAPTTEEFPKLPPRSIKQIPSYPKISTGDNTYNNLQNPETEVNDDEDTNSAYDAVQCSDTQKQKNNEEEPLEIYDEFKITETINTNIRIASFSNLNITHDNYDSVDTGQAELEDYHNAKLMPKISIKVNVSPKNSVYEDEDLVDYYELKPICRSSNLKETSNTIQLQKDEELQDYAELKPIPYKCNQPTQTTSEMSSEEVLEDCNILKPVSLHYQSKQNKPMDLETPKNDKLQNNDQIISPENEELVDYYELKPNSITQPSQLKNNLKKEELTVSKKSSKSAENMTKQIEINNETKAMKPVKPMKKFWERRLSESSKKETDSDDDESKRSVANIKTKFNMQSSISAQEKMKPPIVSPKPRTQTLLNKFPSFSKNKNIKEEDGNGKVQNLRQQLEHTLTFINNK